jgi:hypothetical protein
MTPLNQKQRAKLRILELKQPFTALDLKGGISAQAYREAAGDLDLLCYIAHVGSGNFRVKYFPITWLPHQCYEYMDKQVKRGKSKATIVSARTHKKYERGDQYNLQEFAEKLACLGLHEISDQLTAMAEGE